MPRLENVKSALSRAAHEHGDGKGIKKPSGLTKNEKLVWEGMELR